MWGLFASRPLLVVRAILGRRILCALPQLNNHTLRISVPPSSLMLALRSQLGDGKLFPSSFAPWAKSCSCRHCLSCQTALEGSAVLKPISVAWNTWKSFFQVLPHPWMPCPALLLPAGPLEFPFQFSFPSYSWGAQKCVFTALYPWVSALSPSLGDILSQPALGTFLPGYFPHTLLSLECFLFLLSGVIRKSLPIWSRLG